ncbi:formylglycine-generating enzyme family protein [Serinicoccus kebangsaanensis]|uniref:formylglycine-generating enzyme family protein n=1 Tax=Serinicoccus kebangsaanensis TaxID=2602069 RepID=UPI00124EC71D|nr:formylglycine-generating enzyme family protein [Serinicoccus kebangsaanensis]
MDPAPEPAARCCAPQGERPVIDRDRGAAEGSPAPAGLLDLVHLDGGNFQMGSEDPDANPGDGEGPLREVRLSPFSIGRTAVTNAQFAAFVEATGHRTGAERFGWSFVFAGFLPGRLRGGERPPGAPWWCRVDGAVWSAPEGPGSDISERPDHPVVHVDHDDARAFCAWVGGRLPTEAEWECAARGGLVGARYAWGEDLLVGGEHRCNIWQGRFPVRNTAEDGYAGTAPVGSFPPNGYGLFDVAGNVWEWCSDWWGTAHTAAPTQDPQGPRSGSARVMRGGSYLCHDSYCNRYRVAARTSNDPDSASGNLGFRCVVPAVAGGRGLAP